MAKLLVYVWQSPTSRYLTASMSSPGYKAFSAPAWDREEAVRVLDNWLDSFGLARFRNRWSEAALSMKKPRLEVELEDDELEEIFSTPDVEHLVYGRHRSCE